MLTYDSLNAKILTVSISEKDLGWSSPPPSTGVDLSTSLYAKNSGGDVQRDGPQSVETNVCLEVIIEWKWISTGLFCDVYLCQCSSMLAIRHTRLANKEMSLDVYDKTKM